MTIKSSTNRGDSRLGRTLLSLTAVAALVLTGCGAPGAATESQAKPAQTGDPFSPEVATITGAQYRQTSASPFLAAMDSGIAAEHGLTLKYEWAESSPAMLTQVVSGNAQVGTSSLWGVVNAIQQGMDIRIVGEDYREVTDSLTVEALPNSGIKGIEDLAGKKVGVVGLNSGHDLRIKYALKLKGLDPNGPQFVDLPFGQMGSSLETGAIDAGVFVGTGLKVAKEKLKSTTVMDYGKEPYKDFPALQWVMSGQFVDKNPNAVAAFQCAVVLQGATLAQSDQDLYQAGLKKHLGWDDAAIAATTKVTFPAANDVEQMQIVPDIMHELGVVPDKLDLATVTVPLPENCKK